MGKLSGLINIGKNVEEQLETIAITSQSQLKQVGSKEAWLKIRATDSSVCYNRLCAFEGAIRNVRWHHLPSEVKEDLKKFANQFS